MYHDTPLFSRPVNSIAKIKIRKTMSVISLIFWRQSHIITIGYCKIFVDIIRYWKKPAFKFHFF